MVAFFHKSARNGSGRKVVVRNIGAADTYGGVFAAQDGVAHAALSVSAFTGGLLVRLAGALGAFATAAAFGFGAPVHRWSRAAGTGFVLIQVQWARLVGAQTNS